MLWKATHWDEYKEERDTGSVLENYYDGFLLKSQLYWTLLGPPEAVDGVSWGVLTYIMILIPFSFFFLTSSM